MDFLVFDDKIIQSSEQFFTSNVLQVPLTLLHDSLRLAVSGDILKWFDIYYEKVLGIPIITREKKK